MFFLSCFFFGFIVLFLYLDTRRPKNYPPGPQWIPIIGNLLLFKKLLNIFGYHHLAWQELYYRYGEVVGTKLGRKLVVTVFGEEAVAQVLTREEFEGRPDGFFFRVRTFGKRQGLVFCDGNLWKRQRKFSVQRLKKFGYGGKLMLENVEGEAKHLMENFLEKSSEPILMHDAFDVSVINVLWMMIAGERFELSDIRLKKLMTLIHEAFKVTDMSGGILNHMPFLRFIAPDSIGYSKVVNVTNRLSEFLEETIQSHKNYLNDGNPRDLIDSFLEEMKIENDPTFTDEQLISTCIDLLMAGSETTSNTLSFAVIYMLQYPEVMKKVQNELDDIVGRNNSPRLNDAVKLPYASAVLKEIQRITNVPPVGIAHRAVKKAELLGYTIPEDTILITSLYSVHMDPKTWIDPFVFRPERFLGKEGTMIKDKSFLPFGYGKRQCLGISLAKANYFLFFVSLLHNFNLEKVPEGPLPDLKGCDGITLSPRPFKVKLTPR